MVLIVNDAKVETFTSIDDIVIGDLRTTSVNFATAPTRTVYKHEQCVYVGQQEMAICSKDDDAISIIGSEDATTCHIVILKNRSSSTTGLIHLDSDYAQLDELVKAMVNHDSLNHRGDMDSSMLFDIFIIGGFSDTRLLSLEVSTDLFENMIQNKTLTFHLRLYCSLEINTLAKEGVPWPRHYGAGVSIDTGDIFPAKFEHHGPDKDIRMLRMSHVNTGILLLYASEEGKPPRMCIPAFEFRSLRCEQAHRWLALPDDYLLSKCSTSPLVEPPHFCEDFRNTFRRMITDPKPLTTIFKDGRSRVYERDSDTGDWLLLQPELYGRGGDVGGTGASFSLQDFVASIKK